MATRTEPILGGFLSDRLFFGQDNHERTPIINLPQASFCDALLVPYFKTEETAQRTAQGEQADHTPPMLVISISNVALQMILLFRDFILSHYESAISGEVKLGAVAVLSAISAVGYTIINLHEGALRFTLSAVTLAAALPILLISIVFSFCSDNDTIFDNMATFIGGVIVGFAFSGVQCVAQCATGILAANYMMTYENNLPPVYEITNKATLGIQKLVYDCLSSK